MDIPQNKANRFYTTLEKEGRAEIEEKKSVFIGSAASVKSDEEAVNFIKRIRSEYSDARHNVYAYITDGGMTARYSDDGEPKGTGGFPILELIKKSGCTDVCVVVTRYFGGILLGTGGLTRAYSECAKKALDAAKIVTYEKYTEFEVECPYSEYDKIIFEFQKCSVIVDNTEYSDKIKLCAAVKNDTLSSLEERMREIFSGRITCKITGERYDFK